jgi:hypothetical protein
MRCLEIDVFEVLKKISQSLGGRDKLARALLKEVVKEVVAWYQRKAHVNYLLLLSSSILKEVAVYNRETKARYGEFVDSRSSGRASVSVF